MDWGGARIGRTKDSVKWTVAAAFGAFMVLFVMTVIATPGAEAATTLQWVQTGASGPPGVIDAAMAFDPDAGSVLLYGGLSSDESTVEQGTWTWNGSDWTQATGPDASAPGYLQQASMAYDAGSHQLILFGGDTMANYTNWPGKTWEWNGSGWVNANPSVSPPALGGSAMAYDPGTGDLVLYGGFNANGVSDQTWLWNGSTWTPYPNAGGPTGGRVLGTMTFDADTGQLILYGGLDSTDAETDDTWVWDAATHTWSELSANPLSLAATSVAYDPGNGLVLYGGRENPTTISNETLDWTGGTWSQLNPSTTPGGTAGLDSTAIAYDATNNDLVLWGGYNGTVGSGVTWLGETTPTSPQTPAAVGGTNQVMLSWTAPSNPGAPAGVSHYEIFRGTTPGGEGGTPIYTTADGTATSYTDTECVSGFHLLLHGGGGEQRRCLGDIQRGLGSGRNASSFCQYPCDILLQGGRLLVVYRHNKRCTAGDRDGDGRRPA